MSSETGIKDICEQRAEVLSSVCVVSGLVCLLESLVHGNSVGDQTSNSSGGKLSISLKGESCEVWKNVWEVREITITTSKLYKNLNSTLKYKNGKLKYRLTKRREYFSRKASDLQYRTWTYSWEYRMTCIGRPSVRSKQDQWDQPGNQSFHRRKHLGGIHLQRCIRLRRLQRGHSALGGVGRTRGQGLYRGQSWRRRSLCGTARSGFWPIGK